MDLNKNSGFAAFLLRLLYFSIFIGLILTAIFFLVSSRFITVWFPMLLLFFYVTTSAGYFFLIRSAQKQFIKFVNYYLLITALKLFLFIGIIFFYCLLNKLDAVSFVASFFFLYLCYSVFEVIYLVSYSKSIHP